MRTALLPAGLILVTGCASLGGEGSPLPYEELLGPWEMGEVGREFIHGTATFLENQQVLVQCGTVGERPLAEPPRTVTPRGNGWTFRGCEGTVTVRLDGEGEMDARLSYTEERAYNEQGECLEWVTMDNGRRCAAWDQVIRYREEPRTREIVFQRPGG